MREGEWAAFVFGFGLDQVRVGFRAAIEGCDTMGEKARREYDAFSESLGAFEEDSPEHFQLMDLSHSEWLADNAKSVIREAFVLSAFHYWERRMRAWTNSHKTDFPKLKAKSEELGYPADPDLEVVNKLCNLLKHDKPRYARELGSQWSDLFEELPHGPEDKTEWVLAIKDHHVEDVFDIVGRSAPQIASSEHSI